MDGLLNELEKSSIGYYMGANYMGASGYVDDLKLFNSSVKTLRISAIICDKYAKTYNVLFNAKKCMHIIDKSTMSRPSGPV